MSQTFDKKLNVRINHKYDTYANWLHNDSLILGRGEIAVAEISSGQTFTEPDGSTHLTPPAIGIKIGDGTKKFRELPWIQSTAGDVYAWAKEEAPEKLFKRNPQTNEYIYTDFIKEVEGLVRGTIDDSNTTYEFEYNPATDKYIITSIDITADGEVRQEWAEIDLSKKANKIIVAEGEGDKVVGNIVTLNAYGDIADSNEKLSDYIKAKTVEDTYATIAKVNDIEGSVTENRNAITEIKTETIPTIQTAIADNKARIDSLFPSVDEQGNETNGYIKENIATAITELRDGAPESLDTLKEIADYIAGGADGGAASLVNRVTVNEQNIAELDESVTGLLNKIGTESDGLVADIIANTNAISTLQDTIGDENGGLVKDVADNASAISTNASAISDIQSVIGEDGETKTGLRKIIAELDQTVSNGRVKWDEAVQDIFVGDETARERKYTTKDASKNVSVNAIPLNILENVEGFTLLFDCGNAFGFNV